jgi:alpha-amylase
MWPPDLKLIYDQLNNLPTSWFPSNAKPFIYQEVTDLGGDPITREEYIGMGRVTEFKYSEFIGQVFRKRDGMALKDLANYGS